MKNYMLVFAFAALLVSCESGEKASLQKKVDSLSAQLRSSREMESGFNEVGVLIDSIDASRNLLQAKMIEGSSYSDYVARLQDINKYIKKTEERLSSLEANNKKSSKVTASSIRRLKADLEKRTQDVVDLQLQIASLRDTNLIQWAKLNEKDSILSTKDQIIKWNQADIAILARQSMEAKDSNQTLVAKLYFDQAAALEKAANRTQFAPKRKKASRQEALELYKLSLSLGNTEAQARITALEEKLS